MKPCCCDYSFILFGFNPAVWGQPAVCFSLLQVALQLYSFSCVGSSAAQLQFKHTIVHFFALYFLFISEEVCYLLPSLLQLCVTSATLFLRFLSNVRYIFNFLLCWRTSHMCVIIIIIIAWTIYYLHINKGISLLTAFSTTRI